MAILFDHVVGALPQEQRHVEAERLSGFQIDHQLEFVRSLDGELARFCALEDAVTIGCCTLELADPLYPQKRTLELSRAMSALCQ